MRSELELKSQLHPNKTSGYWINNRNFQGFKDRKVMPLRHICWCSNLGKLTMAPRRQSAKVLGSAAIALIRKRNSFAAFPGRQWDDVGAPAAELRVVQRERQHIPPRA